MKTLIAIILAGSLSIGMLASPLPAFAEAPPSGSGLCGLYPNVFVCPKLQFGNGGSWVPFAIMGYASGIILAAMVANYRDNRELTAAEAWSGGILFWFSPSKPRVRHP